MMRRIALLAVTLSCVAGSARTQSIVFGVGGQLSAPVYEMMMVPIYADLTGAPGLSLGSFTVRISWIRDSLSFMDCDCDLPLERGDFHGSLAVNTDSAYYGVLKVAGAAAQGLQGLGVLFRIPMQFYYYYYTYGTTPITIEVTEASAAGTFADLLPFVTTEDGIACPAVGRWGDLDEDGRANSRDALAILSGVVGMSVPGFDLTLGDVDGDGLTNSRDALILLSYAVGIDIMGQRVLLVAPGACVVPEVPQLAIVPDTIDLAPRQRVRPIIVPTSAGGLPAGVSVLSWSVDDPEIAAMIDETGLMVGRMPGTTVLRAALGPGVFLTAPVVVRPRRGTWYVDGDSALGQPVQLGTERYPLAVPNLAFPAAAEGDTIRFRPGTHEWDPNADRAFFYDDYYDYYLAELYVGVAFIGDTLADGSRPIVRGAYYDGDLDWHGGESARIQDLVLENTYVYLAGLQNLHVENVKFEYTDPRNAIYVSDHQLDTLSIVKSEFVSPGYTEGYRYAVALWDGAEFVQVHDSKFTRFQRSVYLYDVDSLDVRRNEFRFTDVAVGSWTYASQVRPFSTAIFMENVVDSARMGLWATADSVIMTDNVLTQITEDALGIEQINDRGGTGATIARNQVSCEVPGSSPYGIQVYNVPGAVEENVVADCRSYGIRFSLSTSYPLATVTVRGNTVTMPDRVSSSYGMYLNGRFGLMTLYGNTVRNGYYGVYYGPNLNAAAGDTTRLVADSNAISGTGYMGLYLYISTSYTGSAVGIRNNISNNVGYGIYNNFNKVLSFTQGRFVGNGNYAVYSGYAFDATQNYWGDPLGPGGPYGDPGSVGDSISSSVITWDPYLSVDPTDVPPLTASLTSAVGSPPASIEAASVEDRRAAIHEQVKKAREEHLARKGRQ